MLRSRVIPCLLIQNDGLVKTVRFSSPKYVGDPINAVRIFNEKEVDELIVIDIDATVRGAAPNIAMIAKLAAECRMPLCYGGGVKTVEQAQRIVEQGVEKVAVSSAGLEDPGLLTSMARVLGRQSVVAVVDVRKSLFGGYSVYIRNGQEKINRIFEDTLKDLESAGVGEIVVNSIDRDGVMTGYDIKLAKLARDAVSVPLTMLGGAGTFTDIVNLTDYLGVMGVAAGSVFVFKGKYKAVLINYMPRELLDTLNQREF